MARREGLFSFPNPVNEVSARLVAAGVAAMSLAILVLDLRWILPLLVYGFWARALTGPTLSPLGQFVTRVATPALGVPERLVPGPPKRFAQGMGAAVSTTALVLGAGFGAWGAAEVALGLIAGLATLEAAIGFCLGCKVFALLMRTGIIPDDVCQECRDIWSRTPTTA